MGEVAVHGGDGPPSEARDEARRLRVGIPGREHLDAGEQPGAAGVQPSRLARQSDKPLDALRDEHQSIDLRSVLPAQLDNHGQGAIGYEREGVRRVDRDRRQHRQQPIDKQLP